LSTELRFADIRDTKLAVREAGEGPLCVWGHGLMLCMAADDEVDLLDFLRDPEGVRWLRYDARCHGLSPASLGDGDCRWPQLAQDMLALVDESTTDKAVLGGVSMGAATALHAAVAAPERVAGLVLMAPPTAWETRPRQTWFYWGAAHLISAIGLAPLRLAGSLPTSASEGSPMDVMQKALARSLENASASSVAAALWGAMESDLPSPAELTKLRNLPVLILAWPGDPVHPLSTSRRLARLLPQAQLHIAEDRSELEMWPERISTFLETLAF
jgi:3-oxoadipate enol-lactonase